MHMNHSDKRRLSLALLLLAAFAVSCGAETTGDGLTDADAVTTASAENETVNQRNSDDLPETLEAAYQGRTFTIMSAAGYGGKSKGDHRNIIPEDGEDGDPFNDAQYRATMEIADRFGISFREECLAYPEVQSNVRSLVNAGDSTYDLFSLQDRYSIVFAAEGMLIPTDELKYVDLTKPYWISSLNQEITMGCRNYIAASELSITSYDNTTILLFNKALISELGLDNPYDSVRAGKWTYDVFEKMAKTVVKDLDGDGVMGDNDRYGWLCPPKQVCPCIWISGGGQSVSKDADDLPQFTMNNDRMNTLLELAYDLTWGGTIWYQNKADATDVTDPPIFSSGNALFTTTGFGNLFGGFYREIDFDFGIIPYPKYTEEQDSYISRLEVFCPYFVTTTAADPDFSGAMLEALACAYSNEVIPAYYDVALKEKYTRDRESQEMLDLVMATRVQDLGDTLFNEAIRDGFVYSIFNSGKQILVSDIEKNAEKAAAAIEKVAGPFRG